MQCGGLYGSARGHQPTVKVRGESLDPDVSGWFLTTTQRDNPYTRLDGHSGGLAWSKGNHARALVHGATYFAELLKVLTAVGPGDLVLFTDWRGDPDERLDGPGTEIGRLLAGAASRGVDVRGLVWRSHQDRFKFSAAENRRLGGEIEAAGGQCLLDQRVRPLGSHHQKLVVVRHRDRPHDDVAYVGGIDLSHSRRDDARHFGDPQAQPMSSVYGGRPPWHDVQLEIRGPAVGLVEMVFRERWEDPAPLSRNPVHFLGERLLGEDRHPRPLPPQGPDPAPVGRHTVQLLRTYPSRRPGYPFAPHGERSVARGYIKALGRARSLVYLEDQYLWSEEVASVFCRALQRHPGLRMVAVIPGHPDQDGRTSAPPNFLGRERPLDMLRRAAPGRFAVYSLENENGTPIYVHAKVCIVDDTWACIGSDNTNRRSWTHDSELSCAVLDEERGWARSLRLELAAEHLGLHADGAGSPPGTELLGDPVAMFEEFRASAQRLDAWHGAGRRGPRPTGQLRVYRQPRLSWFTRAWSRPLYRTVFDPDGRTPMRRLRGHY